VDERLPLADRADHTGGILDEPRVVVVEAHPRTILPAAGPPDTTHGRPGPGRSGTERHYAPRVSGVALFHRRG